LYPLKANHCSLAVLGVAIVRFLKLSQRDLTTRCLSPVFLGSSHATLPLAMVSAAVTIGFGRIFEHRTAEKLQFPTRCWGSPTGSGWTMAMEGTGIVDRVVMAREDRPPFDAIFSGIAS
jgi:hypothetical protein